MFKPIATTLRAMALAAMVTASYAGLYAAEPGIVVVYGDGTEHSHTLAEVQRVEIGSEKLTVVRGDAATEHLYADVDRILIGTEVTSAVALPVEAAFAVWPNPVSDKLNIQTNNESADVAVYDLGGRVVLGGLTAAKGQTLTINTSSLGAGYYIVKVGDQSVKIAKQ